MSTQQEPILDPDLPIIDAHHHLWFHPPSTGEAPPPKTLMDKMLNPVMARYPRYLLDEFLADLNTGHNIRASVYVDAHAMYRASGPDHMKPVGEVEFVNGVAAMAASGVFGDILVGAGIVGHADLTLGDPVEEVLTAEIQAGGGRFRGVRVSTFYDPDASIMGPGRPGVLADEGFRAGFKRLHGLGLSFDATLLEPQLPELIDLARAFPETRIILCHVGFPIGIGAYAGKLEERFPIWRDNMRTLGKCENAAVKLGGLALPFAGFPSFRSDPPASSEQLASEWGPYIHTCIEAFGVDRCMFESNFPPDAGSCTYPVLWNAFKRVTADASKDERAALFAGTAKNIYRLEVPL